MAWQESPELKELVALVLDYLVEDARQMRKVRVDAEAAAALAGESYTMPLIPMRPEYDPEYDPAYDHRASFTFGMDGTEYVMRSDGSVWFYSASTVAWHQHSVLPGTPADYAERRAAAKPGDA